jgi:predicted methyltransferase MtxX (methanogen marker protein 4)
LELQSLLQKTSSDIAVGIGLVEGDPREKEIREGWTFCPVRVFRSGGELLDALDAGRIRAAVRGSLPSSGFLEELKSRRNIPGLRRIALLGLPCGRPFLLGPVGIDEGRTLEEMEQLVVDCREFCRVLGWAPRIAVLSAGRSEDAGRGEAVAASIERGELLASDGDDIRHYHITIEEALHWANCVLAPDGVTGNLIYRTLVHLGSGSSLGALYFPLELRLADTSRSGTALEYLGAIALANLSATLEP